MPEKIVGIYGLYFLSTALQVGEDRHHRPNVLGRWKHRRHRGGGLIGREMMASYIFKWRFQRCLGMLMHGFGGDVFIDSFFLVFESRLNKKPQHISELIASWGLQ